MTQPKNVSLMLSAVVMVAIGASCRGPATTPTPTPEAAVVAISLANTKIAFTSLRDSNFNIYVMDVDGSNLRRLPHHLAGSANPAWSPKSIDCYADKGVGYHQGISTSYGTQPIGA